MSTDNQRQPAPLSEAIETLAAQLHAIYQHEAKRQYPRKPHSYDYADLPENIKEFDRVLARFILEREASLKAALRCRVCGGTGKVTMGSCVCGGTGKLADAELYERQQLIKLQDIAKQALASTAEGAMSKEEAAKIIDAGFGSRPDLPTGTEFVDEIRHGGATRLRRRSNETR